MSFNERLQEGLAGESVIARWMMRRGWTILPAYEKVQNNFKGPRILSSSGNLIAPDMLSFRYDENGGEIHWIEAKTKTAFTWYRNQNNGEGLEKGGYQDGIDVACWEDYLKLYTLAPWPVWLMFLHDPGHVAKDNPPDEIPPDGLFGNTISALRDCPDHISPNWGRGGMVYWKESDLRLIATWDEVIGVKT